MCISELSKRIAKEEAKKHLTFNNSSSVARYYMEELRHRDREVVLLVMLDKKNNFIDDAVVSVGCIDASIFSVRDIVKIALSHNAMGMILLHNHPSGDPTPSKDDIESTKNLINAANIMGLKVLDHIVIGDNRYESLSKYIRF